MPKIELRSRKDIAKFLPDAMRAAITSYQRFSKKVMPKDAKNFKAHHDACKVAIAHIELLIKLANWADLPDPSMEGEVAREELVDLIKSARGEINGGG